jgi:hypothetical protein
MRRHFSRPATLGVLAAVAAILALVGPFGTDVSLPPGFRALYWLVMVGATYGTGYATGTLLHGRLPGRMGRFVTLPVTALVITAAVVLVNLALLGRLPGGADWRGDLVTIFAIALIILVAMDLVDASLRADTAVDATPPAAPPILDRLPLEKRGALVALSVEDHYVRVVTLKGSEMVLMRLTDAIREAAPEPGLRVHRSHWIATAQVTAARRDGDRAILSMAAGGDIPVSRSHIRAVKEAGLLPR